MTISTTLILLATIIPTAIYVAIIYSVDRYEKEPLWLLTAVFLWGAIPAVLLAIGGNRFFSAQTGMLISQYLPGLTTAAIVAPIVEETVKGIALLGVLFLRRNDIDGPLDGIVYGAMVGMGFAMVENYFYFSAEFARGGYSAFSINVFYRAIVFGLNHALFSSMFGLGIALSRLSHSELIQFVAPNFGWMAGILFHAVHNATIGLSTQYFIIAPLADYAGIFLTITIIFLAQRRERRWLREHLQEEIVLGTLTFRQYKLAGDMIQRRVYLWQLLSRLHWLRYRRTRNFLALLSKLAYQKHYALAHPASQHEQLVDSLREKIWQLGEKL